MDEFSKKLRKKNREGTSKGNTESRSKEISKWIPEGISGGTVVICKWSLGQIPKGISGRSNSWRNPRKNAKITDLWFPR